MDDSTTMLYDNSCLSYTWIWCLGEKRRAVVISTPVKSGAILIMKHHSFVTILTSLILVLCLFSTTKKRRVKTKRRRRWLWLWCIPSWQVVGCCRYYMTGHLKVAKCFCNDKKFLFVYATCADPKIHSHRILRRAQEYLMPRVLRVAGYLRIEYTTAAGYSVSIRTQQTTTGSWGKSCLELQQPCLTCHGLES